MRDKSGTEAGQTWPLSENIEEFKRDRQEEQITGTNRALDPLPAASHPPATLNEAGPWETLADAQAAELAEYLADFSPYAKPAVDPAPDLSSPIPGPGAADPGRKPPPPYDETARRADELFEISHGYKRNNPPKHIPNRRRDEDFRSNSIFGNPRKIYG
jgi:hypothetical protein